MYRIRWEKTWRIGGRCLVHLRRRPSIPYPNLPTKRRGMLPVRNRFCVGEPHRLDPSRCPEGIHPSGCRFPIAPRTSRVCRRRDSNRWASERSHPRELRRPASKRSCASHIEGLCRTSFFGAQSLFACLDLGTMNIQSGRAGRSLCGSCATRPCSSSGGHSPTPKNNPTAVEPCTTSVARTHPCPGPRWRSGFLLLQEEAGHERVKLQR